MEDILNQIGLGHLASTFSDNKVEPTDVPSLNAEQFLALGVIAIGDQARLRFKCLETVQEDVLSSAVVQRLQTRRCGRKRKGNNTASSSTVDETYRIYVGWKHREASEETPFKRVALDKGGGNHKIDLPRTASRDEVISKITEVFFPNGRNISKQLNINQLSTNVATHSGSLLPLALLNGEVFSLQGYIKERATHPIRLYLETTKISQEEDSSLCEESTDIPGSPTPQAVDMDSGTPTVIFNFTQVGQDNNASNLEPEGLPDLDNDILIDEVEQEQEWNNSNESIHGMLKQLSQQIQSEDRGKNIVNVSRQCVMVGAMRAFSRASFNPLLPLSVKFAGEDAIDEGGPTREFLRLLTKDISCCSIFAGPENCKSLDLNYNAVQAGTYSIVGKMLAYSIVHSGPVPNFLSPLMYSALTTDIQELQPTIDDIYDADMKELIIQLQDAEDVEGFNQAVSKADHIIQLAGCYVLTINIDRRQELCDALIHFIVLGRNKQCYQEFCEGLKTLGVLRVLRENPRQMKELFVFDDITDKLTSSSFEALFVIELSEEGSNKRRDEEIVLTNWRDMLIDFEEGREVITLQDVLIFTTGADRVPYLGFLPKPIIKFHAASLQNPESKENFPYANTCANILDLPLVIDYDRFKKNMMAALSIACFTTQ